MSRSRAVYANLESNSEPERARVCQRVAVRASESQSGSHREAKRVTESQREPERDRERASKSQREPVRARANQSELETTRKSHSIVLLQKN